MSQGEDKNAAAIAAADEVQDGMLVGLGSGSTAALLIEELGRRCAAGLRIEGVAPSLRSEAVARRVGIRLRDMAEIAHLDLAIDGTDEIDPQFRAIKGGGGAMLREKIVAAAAARMVVIADATKQVAQLGLTRPLPIEVLPYAHAFVVGAVAELGGTAAARPGFSDQHNLILDCTFGPIADPDALAASLESIPGMLGHGLFLREVDAAYVANAGQVRRIERSGAS